MILKRIIFLRTVIFFVILLNYNFQAWSQNDSSGQIQAPNFYGNLNQFKGIQEEQNLTDDQILYRNKIIIEEYNKTYDIEKFYSSKSNETLTLKGYDFFEKNQIYLTGRNSITSGSIQDNYILNTRDQILLVFQGGRNGVVSVMIEDDGMIYLDFTTPVSALGRTLGEVKSEIISRVENSLTETEVFVSLGTLNRITVTITGEVNIPGVYKIDPFSSVMDALLAAGGIKKSGTLRNIKLFENKKVKDIDLYNFLLGYKIPENNQLLQNNSTIVVPSRGKTVASVGSFSENGIYEILEGKDKVKDLILFSRKFSKPGNFLMTRQSIFDHSTNSKNVSFNDNLNDGDIILSYSNELQNDMTIELVGSVKNPGLYPYNKFNSLLKIIPSTNFLNKNNYNLSIVLERFNNNTLREEFQIQNIHTFLKNKKDIKLYPNDRLYFFDKKDISFLSSYTAMNAFENIRVNNSCKEISDFTKMINDPIMIRDNELISIRNYFKEMRNNISPLASQSQMEKKDQIQKKEINFVDTNNLGTIKENDCLKKIPKIFHYNPKLLISIYKNLKIVKGDVSDPGLYLFNDVDDLNILLNYAGSRSNKHIVSPDQKTISVESNSLELLGAVKFPAVFEFSDGMNISNILKSSEYLLDKTYPFFGVVIRKSKTTNVQKIISFNPSLIISKVEDFKLNVSDKIILFNTNALNTTLEFLEKNKISTLPADVSKNNYGTEVNDNISERLLKENSNLKSENIEKFTDGQSDNKTLEKLSPQSNDYFTQNDIMDNTNKTDFKKALKGNEKQDNETEIIFSKKNVNEEEVLSLCYQLETKTFENNRLCSNLLNELNQSIVFISGNIISPGKYFVGQYADVDEIIKFAGGYSIKANKATTEVSNALPSLQNSRYVYPSGSIYVGYSPNYRANISLIGGFKENRTLSFKPNLKLSSILNSLSQINENSYIYFATIQKSNSLKGNLNLAPFSPIDVINGLQDISLDAGDIIKIYTKNEIHKLLKNYKNDIRYQTPSLEFDEKSNLPKLKGDIPELIKGLSIRVEGSVVNPQQIIVASALSIEKIIEIIGGLNNEANPNNIEIVFSERDELNNFVLRTKSLNFADKFNREQMILPGSLIRVPKVDNDLSLGFVQLTGAVDQPGNYQILKGDTIFEIIKRSGGLSNDAYLKGLVFARIKEQKREKDAIRRLKRELEKAVLVALESQSSSNRVSFSDISSLRELIVSANQFEPVGRVIGDFDSIESLKNTKVVNGDKIFIPSRPNSITVIGEVMSPGSILWSSKVSANQYIEKAAGFTELAETKRIFIIAPNGQATKKGGLWSSNNILPGSTIVVPRRIKLSSNLDVISAVTSVIYQLTVTLAGIDNLFND